jgi:hypothetical protein
VRGFPRRDGGGERDGSRRLPALVRNAGDATRARRAGVRGGGGPRYAHAVGGFASSCAATRSAVRQRQRNEAGGAAGRGRGR